MADNEMDATDPTDGTAMHENAETPKVEEKEDDEARKAFIKGWEKRIVAAKRYYEKPFKRMRMCQQIAKTGGTKDWVGEANDEGGRHVVPILKRHINQSVAQLYAKNPKSFAERKQRRMGQIWDGKMSTLQEAKEAVEAVMQAGGIPDPNYVALMKDAAQVQQYIKLMDGAADTLNILFDYYMNEQTAGFKQQCKAAVRRTKVNGVAYVTLGFQRLMEKRQEVAGRIQDTTDQIARIEQRMREAARTDDPMDDDDGRLEELRVMLADLQQKEYLIVREGPVYGWPRSTSVIVDPAVTHLKTLTGANWWVAEEAMTAEDIETEFKIDVRGKFKKYTADKDAKPRWSDKQGDIVKDDEAMVWRVQDKRSGMEFVICEGYDDYLKEPKCPDVKIERFFTLFPLVFNEIEDDCEQIPPSDVWDARHSQDEYNRARQGLAEHRRQNKPGTYGPAGALNEKDIAKLAGRQSGDHLEIGSITDGQTLKEKLAAIPTVPIDPNLYDAEPSYNDMLRIVGGQAASMGTTKGETATETSIAESSRQTSESSNVDDLDDMLSELARSTGQLMLLELSKDTVVEIVGPGAVWPDMPETREEIAKDLALAIKAGSSGRPNRAAKLANMERGMPVVVQLPGVNPTPIAEEYLNLLEIDAADKVIEGMPSIVALNAMMTAQSAAQPGTGGDPKSDPNAQGDKGAQNSPVAAQNEQQSQPAYPTSATGAGGAPPA
jgi:hypothetical protein